MLTLSHGPLGNLVIVNGSLWFKGVVAWHPIHLPTYFSTAASIPGNQTWARSICLVLTIPWCPSCAICIICFCNFSGITILSPRIINPSTNVNSEKICLYAMMSAEFPIRPFSIQSESLCNVGSSSTVLFNSSLPIARGMLF
jgi:hypothetical protein